MKRLVCGDLHGQYDLWRQIKEYLNPEDEFFFLGDAIDRGPDGFKIMQEILDRPNTHYIRGNHEDMMMKAFREQLRYNDDFRFLESATELWFWNGGETTYNYIIDNNISREKIIKTVEEMPVLVCAGAGDKIVYLGHAGGTAKTIETYLTSLSDYYSDKLIWDRDHLNYVWDGKDNEYIIHGHTPVGYMFNGSNKGKHIETYAGGHKICLDLGAHIWGRACLFNLDTFEVEKYFSKDLTN